MKKILGLDLGTNSIGWALISESEESKRREIVKIGSRIIPMSEDILGKFDSGVTESDTARRTFFRGARRLRERHLLRRERLHRVLNILGFLPEHYAKEIDFKKRLGQFIKEAEPKIAYRFNQETKSFDFLFKKSFKEMLEDFKVHQPGLLNKLNKNGEPAKIPYDWTIYYLRKKALTQKIEKEELAWLLLNFNQKRGYYQLRGEDDEDQKENKITEIVTLKIVNCIKEDKYKNTNQFWFKIILEGGYEYKRTSENGFEDWINTEKDFIITKEINEDGSIKYTKDKRESRPKINIELLPTFEEIEAITDAKKRGKLYRKIKLRTENTIEKSGKTIGTYIYDTLLQSPNQKINGKLVRVVERKLYKDELKKILVKQSQEHHELQDLNLYTECTEELYENNESHKNSILNKGFPYLFLDDIIFYQRPLKSKKSLISDCKYESRPMKDKDGQLIKDLNGKQVTKPIKCIAKSHPLFQEFRIWQWMKNLSIYEKASDKDITNQLLHTEEDWVNLFEWLNDRKDVDHKALLPYLLKSLKLKVSNYRWNYVYDSAKDESKKYPCNKTRNAIISKLGKEKCKSFLTQENEIKIWELLYSVLTKEEADTALSINKLRDKKKIKTGRYSIYNLLLTNGFSEDEINALKTAKLDEKDYGSYSAKATKKLLPLMRIGKYWEAENIHQQTKSRIDKIITGEYDNAIQDRVRDKAINLKLIEDFKGLPLWLTSYVVYDRHSEEGEIKKWKSIDDLDNYLKEFKQHSLRNPIVEQVINETLRVVKDIWNIHGNGVENFFDEIHIELGREMKNPKSDREKITQQNSLNENTNLRIKALLAELVNPEYDVHDVRPYSPYQQEILKLYEDGIINSHDEIPDDILGIQKKFRENDFKKQPSKSDFIRYKLWLDQGYMSPYTGEIIPLSKLFTTNYEIEHIIPQSRHFDDSFSNKVICESVVNGEQYKKNQTGLEFIKNFKGTIVKELSTSSHQVKIFLEEEYDTHVRKYFSKSRGKMNKLLLEDIPEKMIERQLNDTRYISKMVKNLLSNIVRADNKDDGTTSINVLSCNGQITSILKHDWGLNDIWNEIIAPRFERLNVKANANIFGTINEKTNKFLPTVPLGLSKGFTKKRIDHRHHALDALVIACASRNHIHYLNNQNALEKGKNKEQRQQSREDLKRILCYKKYNEGSDANYKWIFKKPWETFAEEAKKFLYTTIISFKQNLRVINKTVNKYESWKDEKGVLRKGKNGNPLKELTIQTKGESWAIRKPMHTPMPYGKKMYEFDILKIAENVGKRELIVDEVIKDRINERLAQFENKVTTTQKDLKANPIKDKEGNSILTTTFKIVNEKFRKRQPISKLSNRGMGGIKTTEDAIKFINKIADNKIQQDLLKHLKENGSDIDKAFSPDGIDNFNSKRKIPVYKLPVAESGDKRFALGERIGTRHKWVEAAEGTNLFFAIYANANNERKYISVPLNEVISCKKRGAKERQKPVQSSVPENYIDEKTKEKYELAFYLSPNDLVYVPTEEERIHPELVKFEQLNNEQIKRIFTVNDFSGYTIYFTPNQFAKAIAPKELDNSYDLKSAKTIDGVTIKEYCIKLKTDRLGNITPIKIKKPFQLSDDVDNNVLSEPEMEVVHEKKTIQRFSSFEERDNDRLKYYASLSQEELLINLKKMVLASYGIKDEAELKDMPRIINLNPRP